MDLYSWKQTAVRVRLFSLNSDRRWAFISPLLSGHIHVTTFVVCGASTCLNTLSRTPHCSTHATWLLFVWWKRRSFHNYGIYRDIFLYDRLGMSGVVTFVNTGGLSKMICQYYFFLVLNKHGSPTEQKIWLRPQRFYGLCDGPLYSSHIYFL